MIISAWTEVQLAIGGALKLARGDARGLGFFDLSIDGFWRSFRAAAICYPLYLFLLIARVSAAQSIVKYDPLIREPVTVTLLAARPVGVQVRASGNGLTTADWAAPLATACVNVTVQVP